MKNILGNTENLDLFDKNGVRVYEYFKSSHGFWSEYTRDSKGNELTFKSSNGYSFEYTRDSNGKILTYKDSNGYSSEYTRDSNGNELTYKNSDGETRGFDIPEFTMEQLVAYLFNFKINI
jgi:hypothetical protein